jgi:3-phosphoshikimate 1-carboxyvinyltransferase
MRMFTAIAAMTGVKMKIEGTGSLRKRPAGMVELPLRMLGASVRTNGGFLPVEVRGPLLGGKITIDGSLSSQFISGLLFALPLAANDSVLTVENPSSRPYIDMTLDVLCRFGIGIENAGYNEFRIKGKQKYKACEIRVEGDWSGASFFLVMAAVSGNITIRNLNINSLQADRRIIDVIKLAGGMISTGENEVTVSRGELRPFEFDISDCPDLAPPLAVLAASCKGKSELYGTRRLIAKESSRGENLASSLRSLGVKVRNDDDRIIIEGTGSLSHKVIGSFGDHRMAMAMASASIISEGGITVDGTECVNKSYPGFFDDFRMAGGNMIPM